MDVLEEPRYMISSRADTTYLLSTWPGEYLLVRTLEDDYSPYSFEQLSKEEIGDTVMVILSGGMVLGSPAAGDEGAEKGIK